jgi:predicted amidohydrolase YtcJ
MSLSGAGVAGVVGPRCPGATAAAADSARDLDLVVSTPRSTRSISNNGAYASHEEAIKGSIPPGKLADFVVLADDPHTVDKDKIKDIAIVCQRQPEIP